LPGLASESLLNMVELARQRQTQRCIAQGTKLGRKKSYDLHPSNSCTLRHAIGMSIKSRAFEPKPLFPSKAPLWCQGL